MSEHQLAICDLKHLRRLLDDYLEAYEAQGESEVSDRHLRKVEKQVKGIATLYFNYNREILDGYADYLKRQGMKLTLTPVKKDAAITVS